MIVRSEQRIVKPGAHAFEIAPHPTRGAATQERIAIFSAEIRALADSTDERPIIEIVSTSTGEDRHGSTIIEWLDETFMRTGHVLWQHDIVPAFPYVAKKLARRQEGDKSVSTIELLVNAWRHLEPALGNLPAFLWETFKIHNMGAISRAFIPLEMKSRRAETIPTEFAENIEYTRVEQTEESFVNVPSNRDAFARTIERARTAGRFDARVAQLIGFSPESEPYVLSSARGGDSALQLKPGAAARVRDSDETRSKGMLDFWRGRVGTVIDVWHAPTGESAASVEFLGSTVNGMLSTFARNFEVVAPPPDGWSIETYLARHNARNARSAAAYRRVADKEAIVSTVESFRSTLYNVLKRCCGCEPYREQKPEVTSEDGQAAELSLLADLANAHLSVIDAAMVGWRNSKETAQRGNYSAQVTHAMWEIEGLIWRAKEWYGAELAIDIPAYGTDALEPIVAAAPAEAVQRMVRSVKRTALAPEQRTAMRTKIAELLRCCGCLPSCEDEMPTLPTDEAKRAEEVQYLRDIADSAMSQVEMGMTIWTNAETDRLRSEAQYMVMDGMWRFDRVVSWLSQWYGEEVEAMPAVDMGEVERALTGFKHERAGAVLSAANLRIVTDLRENLEGGMALCDRLIAAARKEAVGDEERSLRAVELPDGTAQELTDCVRSCEACIPACGETIAACGDIEALAPCATAAAVCRDACDAAISAIVAADGGHADTCNAAADSCDACATECDTAAAGAEAPIAEVLTRTATVARDCATACRAAAAVMPAEEEPAPEDQGMRGTATIRIKDIGASRHEQRAGSQTIRLLVPDAARDRNADDPSKLRSDTPLYVAILKQ